MGVSEIRGTLFGVLMTRESYFWGVVFRGLLFFCKLPYSLVLNILDSELRYIELC